MNESDKGLMLQETHNDHPPQGATICTVSKVSGEFAVNCAGFIRRFRDVSAAAHFLQMPWTTLESLIARDGQSVILLREDASHPWRSSAKFERREIV